MAGRVVVVGSFNVDHVWHCDALPRSGETLSGRYSMGPGGKGFNQAIAARRAGAEAMFVCALGNDAGAQLARGLAADDGLGLEAQRSDAPTGTAGIYVDAAGRNSIVLGPGANATLDTAFVESHTQTIRTASVLLAQLETAQPPVLAALRSARDAGVATLLNPAPSNAEATSQMLALVDILTPNETEFGTLLLRHRSERMEAGAIALMASERLHGLCRDLLPGGTVVVTLGEVGCFVSHADDRLRGDERSWYRVPAESVEAVDTTGAGDAFNGALAASLAMRDDGLFAAHVRFASRYAALSTERAGAAVAMPTLAEVQARFGG